MSGDREPAIVAQSASNKGLWLLLAVIAVIFVLLLLLRKLIWCLRWLWCWKHDRETPPPIGWLPSRDGGRFDAHMQKRDGEG